jgi:6-phosphogluconolactonase (cycloisomerase 2 family)
MLVANLESDTVVVLPIENGTGALGRMAHQLKFEGPLGPHRVQQRTARPHQCVFDAGG